jgi:hypothetical protein
MRINHEIMGMLDRCLSIVVRSIHDWPLGAAATLPSVLFSDARLHEALSAEAPSITLKSAHLHQGVVFE